MEPILVITTCAEEKDAEMLARNILEKRLGACVQIYNQVKSWYWWKGHIAQDNERVVFIKSSKAKFNDLQKLLLDLHPYDVPEIISIRIDEISPSYLVWLTQEMGISDDA